MSYNIAIGQKYLVLEKMRDSVESVVRSNGFNYNHYAGDIIQAGGTSDNPNFGGVIAAYYDDFGGKITLRQYCTQLGIPDRLKQVLQDLKAVPV